MANTAPSLIAAADGVVFTRIGTSQTATFTSAVQADGKIVIAGQVIEAGVQKIALMRLKADGSLDTTFGIGGKLVTSGGLHDFAISLVLQPDGKIVVLGQGPGNGGAGTAFGVFRYNTDGSLDGTFSGDGAQIVDFGFAANDETPGAVALQADGKIVLVGTASIGGDRDFIIARLNADGTPDMSFSGDGRASFNFNGGSGSDDDRGMSVAVQTDGKIVVLGTVDVGGVQGLNFGVVRFNADGTVDTNWNRTFGGTDEARSVVLQPDGKIVVAGFTNGFGTNDFALARFNSDGSFDSGFNGNANAITDFGSNDQATSVALQADGKIVVAGFSGAAQDVAIARYNADGTPDMTFDGDGKKTINLAPLSDDVAYDIVIQPDGKIVLTGYSIFNATVQSAVVRLNADGTLDATFGATTYVEDAAPVVIDHGISLTDAEQNVSGNYAGSSLLLTRDTGPNAEDVFSGAQFALNQGSPLVVNGTGIGTVTTNAGGILQISFNAFATQSLVELALQQIAYSNSSENPPASVSLKWTFLDGDATTPLSATVTSVIAITSVPPTLVKGTNGNDKIDATHAVNGKTTTAEEDQINGKKGNDKIKAAGGDDTINGGAGKDTITGGEGRDTFVFKDKLLAANVDLIKDFAHDVDLIGLHHNIFKVGVALENKEFYAKAGATSAHDKNDRIIYDKTTGKLYYDEDGNKAGGKAAVLFATLDKHPVIDAGDFLIV